MTFLLLITNSIADRGVCAWSHFASYTTVTEAKIRLYLIAGSSSVMVYVRSFPFKRDPSHCTPDRDGT